MQYKRVPRRVSENLEKAESTMSTGKLSKAAVFARKAYAAAVEDLPPDHPTRREAARTLGMLLISLSQPEEGGRLLRESGDLPAAGASVAPETQDEMLREKNEILICVQQGRLEGLQERANRLLERARMLGEGTEVLVWALQAAALVREEMDDLKRAERLYREAFEIQERMLDASDAAAVPIILDLARVLLKKHRFEQAEPLYRRALALQQAREAPDQVDLAVTLNQLAHVCGQTGRPDEAIEHLERSLRIRQETLGADHPQVAVALHGLAARYMASERHDEADAVFERACLILDRALGTSHPRAIDFLLERGMNRIGQGQPTLGLTFVDQAASRASLLPPGHPLRMKIQAVRDAGLALEKKLRKQT